MTSRTEQDARQVPWLSEVAENADRTRARPHHSQRPRVRLPGLRLLPVVAVKIPRTSRAAWSTSAYRAAGARPPPASDRVEHQADEHSREGTLAWLEGAGQPPPTSFGHSRPAEPVLRTTDTTRTAIAPNTTSAATTRTPSRTSTSPPRDRNTPGIRRLPERRTPPRPRLGREAHGHAVCRTVIDVGCNLIN